MKYFNLFKSRSCAIGGISRTTFLSCQQPPFIYSSRSSFLSILSSQSSLVSPLSSTHRSFHTSRISFFAKNKKASKESAEENEISIEIPNAKDIELDMNKRIIRLNDEFSKLRGGRVSADMFNHLVVEAYGSRIPLTDAGQVTLRTGNKLNVSVFDPELVNSVSKTIQECGLGLNPQVEGSSIAILVPKPSKEARESVVKMASKVAEKVRNNYIYITQLCIYFNLFILLSMF